MGACVHAPNPPGPHTISLTSEFNSSGRGPSLQRGSPTEKPLAWPPAVGQDPPQRRTWPSRVPAACQDPRAENFLPAGLPLFDGPSICPSVHSFIHSTGTYLAPVKYLALGWTQVPLQCRRQVNTRISNCSEISPHTCQTGCYQQASQRVWQGCGGKGPLAPCGWDGKWCSHCQKQHGRFSNN